MNTFDSSHLEEVFDTFWIITVAFSADPLHLFDLSGLTRGLNVLEVNLGILREIDDGSQEVEQT